MENNKLVKYLTLSALAGATVIGGVVYYNKFRKLIPPIQPEIPVTISDEILITFLKDLKSQSFPHFFLVSGIVKSLQHDITDEQQYEVMYAQICPEVEQVFNSKQNLVLAKYPYKRKDFEHSIQNSLNPRVQKLQSEFVKHYLNALQGISPTLQLKQQTLNKFDEEYIVRIIKEVLQCSMSIIYKVCKQLKFIYGPDYQISISKPEFLKLLHDNDFPKEKRNILLAYKVHEFEDAMDDLGEPQSPSEVFSKLSQNYKNRNENFRLMIDKLEKDYEMLIGRFMIEDIKEEDSVLLINEIKMKKYN